jgi:hypothetical protein
MLIAGVGFFAGRVSSSRDGATALAAGDGDRSAVGGQANQAGQAPDGNRRRGSAGGGLERAGIPAAAKAVLGQGLDSMRIERWIQFLDKNLPGNAVAIAEFLEAEKLEGRDYPISTMLFWQTWAKQDPKGALAYLREHEGNGGGSGIGNLMKAWVVFDPAGALDAFNNLGDSPLSGSALSGLAQGLAGSDPAGAVDFATQLPNKLQAGVAAQISDIVVRESKIEEAQAWFDGLPSGKQPLFQKEAVRVLLDSMTRRSEHGAVEKFVTERLDQAWSARPTEQNFAASMILRNGGSPWDYVSKVMEKYPRPEEPLALTAWVANLNPQSAIDWADANPNHQATDAILAGTARTYLQRGNPDEAAVLLERIKDPALRDQAEAIQVVEKR